MTIALRASGLFIGLLCSITLAQIAAGCGGGGDVDITSGSNGAGAAGSTGSTASAGSGGSTGDGGGATVGSSTSTGTGGAPAAVADPDKDGPYKLTEIDDTVTVPATGNDVPIYCAYPNAGPEPGPYPVVVIAHGLQVPASQYQSYAKRLATFGYVAIAADFPVSIFGVNNTENAQDLLGALDWAGAKPELAGKADVNLAGMTGHSLGGKVALFAATMDARVKASITLDPVDGGMGNCMEPSCVDMSSKMGMLSIPTGFLGETIDSKTGPFGQSCAPPANNYTTFYAAAKAPSLEVTITGASHMSFLDDPNCGFACNACNAQTAAPGTVNAMARAYVVAFYERYLRGNVAYDAYLTGAEAKARYIDTGMATIQSK